MEDKNKVFIFDKKEVALIFLFMLLIALTSFSVGIKVGRDFSFEKGGIVTADLKAVQLKSIEEEKVKEVVKKQKIKDKEKDELEEQKESDATYQKLEEEFEKINRKILDEENDDPRKINTKSDQSPKKSNDQNLDQMKAISKAGTLDDLKQHIKEVPQETIGQERGKYTIQLGSYQLQTDALKFADGFRVRGYRPIISEVSIPDKGIWYRVSLGVFENVAEAKDYINREESLFQGQPYVIREF